MHFQRAILLLAEWLPNNNSKLVKIGLMEFTKEVKVILVSSMNIVWFALPITMAKIVTLCADQEMTNSVITFVTIMATRFVSTASKRTQTTLKETTVLKVRQIEKPEALIRLRAL